MNRKPAIPAIERFPTVPRADGRYQKRIRGHLFYFGRHGDRVAALAEYDKVKHALYEGRSAAIPNRNPTIHELCYRLLDEKLAEAKANRIALGTYHDYVAALKRFAKFTGGKNLVLDLSADTFSAFARHLRKDLGPFAYNRNRAHVVAMFNHAVAADWIEHPVKLGKGFGKATAAELREVRKMRLIPTGVVQQCLRGSAGQLHAIILLGCLGGYGAGDCSALLWRHVDLDKALIRFPRPKTGIARETPITGDTVKALRIVRLQRPHDELVFRTSKGNPWVRQVGKTYHDAIGWAWKKLQVSFEQPELFGFYGLRHTFATHANATQDRDAVRRVMGHALSGLDDVYVETVMMPRLRAVVDHVALTLLPKVVDA